MSTVIGHCCAALGMAQLLRKGKTKRLDFGWLTVLCMAACAPDIDYLFLALNIPVNGRPTHSLSIAVVLPIAIILGSRLRMQNRLGPRKTAALVMAGLSHIMLDLLVGVTPLPLFWPFSHMTFQLPFGILPSAGGIRLDNPYLYRNLFIELGVIVPMVAAIFICTMTRRTWASVTVGCVSLPFMVWAASLTR